MQNEAGTEEVVEADEIIKLGELIKETNSSIVLDDPITQALKKSLAPIAAQIPEWVKIAEEIEVTNANQAKQASLTEAQIKIALRTVKQDDVFSGIVKGLHSAHKKWTGFRSLFTDPMEAAKQVIHNKRLAWEEIEREKAAEEERRLQAIADEKARKEKAEQDRLAEAQRKKEQDKRDEEARLRREAQETENAEERVRLEKEADRKAKEADAHAEQVEVREENADAVETTQVHVAAPVQKGGSRLQWFATVIAPAQFFQALSTQPQLQGFVKVDLAAMKRAKAANPLTEIPGVKFEQKRV